MISRRHNRHQLHEVTQHFSNRLEYGHVTNIKGTYGFILNHNTNKEIFFHQRETNENLQIGDEVEYLVDIENNTNRLFAFSIRRLPNRQLRPLRYSNGHEKINKGPLLARGQFALPAGPNADKSNFIEEGKKTAKVLVETQISPGPHIPSASGQLEIEETGDRVLFTRVDQRVPSIHFFKGDIVEAEFILHRRTGQRKAQGIRLKDFSREGRERGVITSVCHNSYGFIRCAEVNEPKLFFHFSERLDNDYLPMEGHGLEFNIDVNLVGKSCATRIVYVPAEKISFTKVLPTVFKGQIISSPKQTMSCKTNANGFKLVGGKISLNTKVANECKTEFLAFDSDDICNENRHQKLFPNDKVQFQIEVFKPTKWRRATNVKLIEQSNHTVEKGIVAFVKDGEYGFIERPNETKNIYFKLARDDVIETGDSVEYLVVGRDSEKMYADDVKILPKGTVSFFEFSEESFCGVVIKTPNETSGDLKNCEGGVIMFLDENGNDVEASQRKTIKFSSRDLLERKFALKEGDLVSFKRREDKRFNEVNAVEVELIKPREMDEREKGVVISLRQDYGFLASFDHPDGIYFHFSCVVGDAKNLIKCGDEFSFEVLKNRNGKFLAARLFKLPSNSVELDKVSPTWFVGKIQNNGYSFIPDIGFRGNGKGFLDFCQLEVYNEIILNLCETTVINEQNNREISQAVSSLPFRSSDVKISPFSLAQFDFVRFQIACEKSTGKLRATNISPLPKLGVIHSAANLTVPGELQDEFSKEFLDFKDKKFAEKSIVIYDVKEKLDSTVIKREAVNLRSTQPLVLEKGFYEGFVKELKFDGHSEKTTPSEKSQRAISPKQNGKHCDKRESEKEDLAERRGEKTLKKENQPRKDSNAKTNTDSSDVSEDKEENDVEQAADVVEKDILDLRLLEGLCFSSSN